MSTIFKLIISIFKFMWKKLGIIGILFVVILFVVPIGVALFDDASDEYVYEVQWYVEEQTIEQVEKTQDKTKLFSQYELDEKYGKKYMYQVEIMITNKGVNPVNISRDFNFVHVEDESKTSRYGQIWEYYYEMDKYYRPDTSVIASGRTMPVKFIFIFEEDDVPNTLYFFDSYDGEKLFSIDVPVPKDI